MSQSLHMRVRDAVVALLLATPAMAAGRVLPNRRVPLPAETTAQVLVYLEDSVASHDVIGLTQWGTRIRIECVARSTAGATGEATADELATEAHARIMAQPDLGGIAIDTEAQAMAWSEAESDPTLSVVQQIFTVMHASDDASIAT